MASSTARIATFVSFLTYGLVLSYLLATIFLAR